MSHAVAGVGEREMDVRDEVGPSLADDIIAEIKINSPLRKC